MNPVEDDDIKLLRASSLLLSDLENVLPKLVRKRKRKHDTAQTVTTYVRETDIHKVFTLIEPFQENPQLLDPHLKFFIPPLVAAYLDALRNTAPPESRKGFIPLTHAICQILNLFCKVRGEKVIKGFLNNEPRYLEPILSEFESERNWAIFGNDPLPRWINPWAERYMLLLWLSHLMLAPFPLATMSPMEQTQETSTALGIQLPPEVPGITLRVLVICIKSLKSASKERGAAANLLVRLCIRPDMSKIKLLDGSLMKWALTLFPSATGSAAPDIHECLGVLSFFSGLVTSASNADIGPLLPAVYQLCQSILTHATLESVKSSAVARKLVIKILRNVAIHCLLTDSSNDLDTTNVLEEVIDVLLDALADGDTPVRYAASKALSIITMKLDSEMATEIVEVLLERLEENVYWQGSKRNLGGVNSLRWHGLTLTLSHLLYRRALSPDQLPKVLNALLLALAFEQRSTTGGSIGTNVRDAACFGVWALSRRYATEELRAVETSSVRASQHQGSSISILQVLAIDLLVAGCLDPAGNIRRGSSAALQELVGRHPNTVHSGISVVQLVDFHTVGLRERAMCSVAVSASRLSKMYWDALFENLLGWRGTGSLDSPSRLFAARAVGLLFTNQTPGLARLMADRICSGISQLRSREVEERQGLVSALASLIDQCTLSHRPTESVDSTLATFHEGIDLLHIWSLLNQDLKLEDKSFMSPALRPDLTASSICNFLGALAMNTNRRGSIPHLYQLPISEIVRLFNLCLGRHADSVLEVIPRTTTQVLKLFSIVSPTNANELVSGWLSRLDNEASYNGLRWSGFAVALGAGYSFLGHEKATEPTHMQTQIARILSFRCTSEVAVEPRTVALLAISILLKACHDTNSPTALLPSIADQLANALHIALNDYTVTERGDVGALVRLEALSTMGTAWETGLLDGSSHIEELRADVLGLALEKLDKVRLRAAQVLEKGSYEHFKRVAAGLADGVSSYEYFASALTILHPKTPIAIREAICLGFITSAGMGSESVVQNSRAALLDAAGSWPTEIAEDEDRFSLLDFANHLATIFQRNLETERILLPLLELIAFLFDMQVPQRLATTSFNFRTILSCTQKAHYKSTHMQKLHLSLEVYRGLGSIPATRVDTITKVASMLLHPFPKIRITAAETLWMLTQEEGLKRQDWSLPAKNLKPVVSGLRDALSQKA